MRYCNVTWKTLPENPKRVHCDRISIKPMLSVVPQEPRWVLKDSRLPSNVRIIKVVNFNSMTEPWGLRLHWHWRNRPHSYGHQVIRPLISLEWTSLPVNIEVAWWSSKLNRLCSFRHGVAGKTEPRKRLPMVCLEFVNRNSRLTVEMRSEQRDIGEGVSDLLTTDSGETGLKGPRLRKAPATLDQQVNLLPTAWA